MPILLISNYIKREQVNKENQRKGKITNASKSAEFLVTVIKTQDEFIMTLMDSMQKNNILSSCTHIFAIQVQSDAKRAISLMKHGCTLMLSPILN